MSGIPVLLNRLAGPFFTGALMAAAASTDAPASAAVLFSLACACGFLSLPGKDRLIARALRMNV